MDLRDLYPVAHPPPGSGAQSSGSGEVAWRLYALVFSAVRWGGSPEGPSLLTAADLTGAELPEWGDQGREPRAGTALRVSEGGLGLSPSVGSNFFFRFKAN